MEETESQGTGFIIHRDNLKSEFHEFLSIKFNREERRIGISYG